MMTQAWVSIVLALITLAGGCGWIVDHHRYRQQVKGLKADNRMKDMELGRLYVDEFSQNIAEPLQREVRELRNEVNQLKDAIQKINDCPYNSNCPVRGKLREQQGGKSQKGVEHPERDCQSGT